MQSLIRYTERDYSKGYNDTMKPEVLPAGYAADILNGVVDSGALEKRKGYTAVGATGGDYAILGLGALEKADGTKRIYRTLNTKIQVYDGSSWADVTGTGGGLTAGLDMNFCQAANNVYTFNGTDNSRKLDGSTAADITAIPKGKYAVWFHNYMFVAGVSSVPSRLYFSNVEAPETWTAADYIDINPDDGDSITGLDVLGDELIIYKKNRVWALTGFSTAGFTITKVNNRIGGHGCVAPRSVQSIGNDAFFLSFIGNQPHIRTLQRTRYAVNVAGGIISEDIEATFNGANKSRLNQAASIFDGRKYYLSYPTGSSTTNDGVVIYDTIHKGFVRWTGLNASCWVISTIGGRAEIYFGSATANGLVYKLDTSTSDNGAAIDFQYKSRAYTCRGELGDTKADTKAKWKYLYLTADSGNDVDLTVQVSPDLFTFETEATMDLSGSSSVLPFVLPQPLGTASIVRERVNIGQGPTYLMQFKFKQSEANKPVTIREHSVLFKPKKLRNA